MADVIKRDDTQRSVIPFDPICGVLRGALCLVRFTFVLVQQLDDPCGIAHRHCVVRYIPGDHRSRAHHGVTPYPHAGQDRCTRADPGIVIRIPVVIELLGVHGGKQVGDGDVLGAAVDAVAAGGAGDQVLAVEDLLHLLHRRQLRFVQGLEVLHEGDVVPHLLHIAHAGEHHQHTGEARGEPQGVAGGTAAVEGVQYGLGIVRQVHQIAALYRLHNDDGFVVLHADLVAGAALDSGVVVRKHKNGGRNMEYLTLHNGVRMPLVGFGTFMLGGETCANAVAAAIEKGYRMIDTAEAYGNEREVGEGIRRSGIDRRELFLVTKVNFRSYEHAEESVMQSLAALQTDYIDLLLLHWPFANYYAAWRVLERLYAEGKARAIGVSNFEPDQLIDLIAYNKVAPAVNQIETNLYCQRSRERGWMDKKQVAHMAYAPLGQGSRNEMYQEAAVLALAEQYGKTPTQILLRFLTQKGVAVIPRSTNPAHIQENFALFDFALSDGEMAQLAALDRKEPRIGRPETPELVEFSLTW